MSRPDPCDIGAYQTDQLSQTITFGPLADKTYGDPDFTVSATTTSPLVVSFTGSGNCTVSGNTIHITASGACTVTAHQGGSAVYSPATDVSQSFTIGKAALTVTANNKSVVYGSPLPTLTYTPSGLVNGDSPGVVSGVSCTTTATNASVGGTYSISCSGGTATNYTISYVDGALTIGYGVSNISLPGAKATFKIGSTIPVKFVLTDVNGKPISNTLAASLGCAVTATFDSQPSACAAYDPIARVFQANLKTPSNLTVGASYPITIAVKVGKATITTVRLNVVIK